MPTRAHVVKVQTQELVPVRQIINLDTAVALLIRRRGFRQTYGQTDDASTERSPVMSVDAGLCCRAESPRPDEPVEVGNLICLKTIFRFCPI